jgi:hypothetical protein
MILLSFKQKKSNLGLYLYIEKTKIIANMIWFSKYEGFRIFCGLSEIYIC